MSQEEKETLLIRIDERTENIIVCFKRLEIAMDLLSRNAITRDEFMKHAEQDEKTFVTKTEFQPVKMIVYGFVSLILMAVTGGLFALVVR